jgi:hypothetical protein
MQITTLTFFKYQGIYNKVWAFGMMQFAHGSLAQVKGQTFYKLMGSGKGLGFNPLPDWSVYSLLQVWEKEEDAEFFFSNAKLMQRYRQHCVGYQTYFLKNLISRGKWSGQNPFQPHSEPDKDNPYVAVITRATIKWSKLFRFWAYVPTAQQFLQNNPDLLYTKGIGEMPILQMATFSLWRNKEAIQKYAYQNKEHATAIQMTRTLDWYREELFARFQPYRTKGEGSEDIDFRKNILM